MSLHRTFEQSGNWLFRWRSYLPLVLTALVLNGMQNFAYPFQSHAWDYFWEFFCVGISLLGMAIRVYVVGHVPAGTSGRNTSSQLADTLNTTGLYSVVRHPLYLGNFFCWLGISLFPHVWWISVITILAFCLYYERIMFAEEAFLREKYGSVYEDWANKTPAFFPYLANWTPPCMPFSWRTVLRREYSGFYAIVVVFTLLEVVGDLVVHQAFHLDLVWIIFFTGGTVLYLGLRTVKKRTKLLHVEGR